MALYRQEFAVCPWCEGETESRVDHLYGDQLPREAGPWFCKKCGKAYRVNVMAPSQVNVTKDERQSFGRAMVLLKFDGKEGPVFFVMDHRLYHTGEIESDEELQGRIRYFFEEHSCPTNWIGECAAVIKNGNCDPHGFLDFVRVVEVPQDFDDSDDEKWVMLFPEILDSAIIDGELASPMLFLKRP